MTLIPNSNSYFGRDRVILNLAFFQACGASSREELEITNFDDYCSSPNGAHISVNHIL